MKTVLITGAGGFLGRELLNQLKQHPDFLVYAITSNPVRLREIISAPNIEIVDKNGFIPWDRIDIVLHGAFSRSENAIEIAKSIDYCLNIFVNAIQHDVPAIINISSQSVYGQQPVKWKEEKTLIEPQSIYAMGKYATEVLLESLAVGKSTSVITNLRLSSIMMNARFVSIFVKNALQGQPINVIGGNQKLSFIDVRDATNGIIALMQTEYSNWEHIYNLGTSVQVSLLEIANLVKEIAIDYIDVPVTIIVEDKNVNLDVCMDSRNFYSLTNWKPKYDIRDMIISLFEWLIKCNNDRRAEALNKYGGGVIEYNSKIYPFSFMFQ